MTKKAYYTYEDLSFVLGLSVKTISQYVCESRPGRRYASHPFPKRDGKIGRSPFWLPDRLEEIVEWNESRLGRGFGGGRRPRVAKAPEEEPG